MWSVCCTNPKLLLIKTIMHQNDLLTNQGPELINAVRSANAGKKLQIINACYYIIIIIKLLLLLVYCHGIFLNTNYRINHNGNNSNYFTHKGYFVVFIARLLKSLH